MSVVFRRGIVLLHTAATPTVGFLEKQLGLPSHEHGPPNHLDHLVCRHTQAKLLLVCTCVCIRVCRATS